jgi:hypothetical protein
MKNIIVILLLLTLYSCVEKHLKIEEDGLNKELKEFVNDYANEVDQTLVTFGDDNQADTVVVNPYYSIFFFNRNNKSFLTIWVSSHYPTIRGLFNDTIKFKNYQFSIEIDRNNSKAKQKRYLTIIDFNKKYDLYDTCQMDYSLKEQLQDIEPEVIYDGSRYARTYEFSKIEGKYQFKLCDFLYAEPLDSNFIAYERHQQKVALRKFYSLIDEFDLYKEEYPKDTLTMKRMIDDIKIAKSNLNKIGNSLIP